MACKSVSPVWWSVILSFDYILCPFLISSSSVMLYIHVTSLFSLSSMLIIFPFLCCSFAVWDSFSLIVFCWFFFCFHFTNWFLLHQLCFNLFQRGYCFWHWVLFHFPNLYICFSFLFLSFFTCFMHDYLHFKRIRFILL